LKVERRVLMELNPNHPTTMAVSDHWYKIAALLMKKFGKDNVVITSEDMANMPPSAITVQDKKDGIYLRLVDMATAERLAKQEGGLPI
jgi:hypothetical protein